MKEGLKAVLMDKIPKSAVQYCFGLWEKYPFGFVLSKKRLSKLGDYRYHVKDQSHTVTVNSDLNPYQFLITYVHEVAHRVVHKPRSRQLPHGMEWKNKFRELMLPLLNAEVFPDNVLRVLAKHMKNPKASTSADHTLVKVLSTYDRDTLYAGLTLDSVPIGQEFLLRKRRFRKLEVKRTRALCLDLNNHKRYLIPQIAEVSLNSREKVKAQSVELGEPTKQSKQINSSANQQMKLFE